METESVPEGEECTQCRKEWAPKPGHAVNYCSGCEAELCERHTALYGGTTVCVCEALLVCCVEEHRADCADYKRSLKLAKAREAERRRREFDERTQAAITRMAELFYKASDISTEIADCLCGLAASQREFMRAADETERAPDSRPRSREASPSRQVAEAAAPRDGLVIPATPEPQTQQPADARVVVPATPEPEPKSQADYTAAQWAALTQEQRNALARTPIPSDEYLAARAVAAPGGCSPASPPADSQPRSPFFAAVFDVPAPVRSPSPTLPAHLRPTPNAPSRPSTLPPIPEHADSAPAPVPLRRTRATLARRELFPPAAAQSAE